jgi:hypothetical protein
MTTAIAERRELHQVIDTLADDRLMVALDFVKNLCDGQPNAKTAAVIADAFSGNVGRARTRQEFFNAMHQNDSNEDA